jgi:hypothetical protein
MTNTTPEPQAESAKQSEPTREECLEWLERRHLFIGCDCRDCAFSNAVRAYLRAPAALAPADAKAVQVGLTAEEKKALEAGAHELSAASYVGMSQHCEPSRRMREHAATLRSLLARLSERVGT